MSRDPGLVVVDDVYRALQVDDEHAVRSRRGFVWQPHRLSQSIDAGRSKWSEHSGVRICGVTIRSELVVDIEDLGGAEMAANEANQTSGTSAIVVNREARSAALVASLTVHSESTSTYRALASVVAATQIAEAEAVSDWLASRTGGKAPDSHLPSGRLRPDRDDMLNLLGTLPAMGVSAGLRDHDFYVCAFPPNSVEGHPAPTWLMASPAPDAVTIELPFTGGIPAVYLDEQGGQQPGTALLILQSIEPETELMPTLDNAAFRQRLARYGPGLGFQVSLPLVLEDRSEVPLAAHLNRNDAEQFETSQIGTWHSAKPQTLSLSGYLPSLLFAELSPQERAVLLSNIARLLAGRVARVRKQLSGPDALVIDVDGNNPLYGFSWETTEDLIRNGESGRVEFKETARWNVKENRKDKRMEVSVLKTVAAFMNSDGGTLIIGVDDEGQALGLDRDCAVITPSDLDGFENWFYSSLLFTRLGGTALGYVDVKFDKVDGHDVCVVNVEQSAEPVFADFGEEDRRFWVRTGNSTNQLKGGEIAKFIRQHFADHPAQESARNEVQEVAANGYGDDAVNGVKHGLGIPAISVERAAILPHLLIEVFEDQTGQQDAGSPEMDLAARFLLLAVEAMRLCASHPLEDLRQDLHGVDTPIWPGTVQSFVGRVSAGSEAYAAAGSQADPVMLSKAMPAFVDGITEFGRTGAELRCHLAKWFLLALATGTQMDKPTIEDHGAIELLLGPHR